MRTYASESIERFQSPNCCQSVVITTDSSNELKRRILSDLTSAGLNVKLLVDSKCDDGELRKRGHVFDHERLCQRYGRRKVEVFNGRWINNAAKLAIFDYVAQLDEPVWAFEDDVYCRDWASFVDAYRYETSDFIGSIFYEQKQFSEFYKNGWLCGHPDHLVHGVAGLYAFRITPKFAQAVLDALKSVRHSSHHELFIPWVCRHFLHKQLIEGHTQHMCHNLDSRTNSGMQMDALNPSGIIFHPVKQGSLSKYRSHAIPNPPKAKVWIVINSFNSTFYLSSCTKLVEEIRRQLQQMIPQPRILIVFGGSADRRVDSLSAFSVCRIQQNLSDYGSLVGVHDALAAGLMKPADRCVVLHDTVWPKKGVFLQAMIDIQNARTHTQPFFFAHPLGWYNLGVGRAEFLAQLGSQYAKVKHIPKELAYELEHGKTISIDGVKLSALREHSVYTIAKHRVSEYNFQELTTHATGAVCINGKSRVVVFIASLGVLKFTHGPTSYQVPIYADADLPKTEKDWFTLRRKYPQLDWCLPLVEIAAD